jgi:hypothetical protein
MAPHAKPVIISTDSFSRVRTAKKALTTADWPRRTEDDDRNLATKVDISSAASEFFSHVERIRERKKSCLGKARCRVLSMPASYPPLRLNWRIFLSKQTNPFGLASGSW